LKNSKAACLHDYTPVTADISIALGQFSCTSSAQELAEIKLAIQLEDLDVVVNSFKSHKHAIKICPK